MSAMVWVEISEATKMPIRIFRSQKAAWHLVSKGEVFQAKEMERSLAVHLIRHQLFVRSKGECELCGSIVTEGSGHMHERQHRGQAGEISLNNSAFICAACHQNPFYGQHKNRNPHFTRRKHES